MFNTLVFVRHLEDAGVSRKQAEAHALALSEIVENDLATKADLKELEHRLIFRLSAITGSMITILGTILGVMIALK